MSKHATKISLLCLGFAILALCILIACTQGHASSSAHDSGALSKQALYDKPLKPSTTIPEDRAIFST